jgi:magnesium-transporting ATPase (P-type)
MILQVLTGDKLETSISVALSCNLLADSMHLFLLAENVSKSVPQLLRSMLDEARRQHNAKLESGKTWQLTRDHI